MLNLPEMNICGVISETDMSIVIRLILIIVFIGEDMAGNGRLLIRESNVA